MAAGLINNRYIRVVSIMNFAGCVHIFELHAPFSFGGLAVLYNYFHYMYSMYVL